MFQGPRLNSTPWFYRRTGDEDAEPRTGESEPRIGEAEPRTGEGELRTGEAEPRWEAVGEVCIEEPAVEWCRPATGVLWK